MIDVREYEPFFGKWKVCAELEKTDNGGRYIVRNKENSDISILNHISIPRDENYMNAAKRWVPQDGDIEEYFEKNKNLVLDEINFGISLSKCENIFGTYECNVIKREFEIGWDIFIRLEDTKKVVQIDKPDDVVKMGIDICTALEFCVDKGLCHGNITPDAIFVSQSGDYKLGKFKLYKSEISLNRCYAAPEAINKEETDIRADIYSLGIVMYRYLNNNALPFVQPEERSEMVIRQACIDRIKGKRMLKPVNADGTLGRIILKACRLNPKERYLTPTEFKNDLLYVRKRAADKSDYDCDETEAFTEDIAREALKEENELTTENKSVLTDCVDEKKEFPADKGILESDRSDDFGKLVEAEMNDEDKMFAEIARILKSEGLT